MVEGCSCFGVSVVLGCSGLRLWACSTVRVCVCVLLCC